MKPATGAWKALIHSPSASRSSWIDFPCHVFSKLYDLTLDKNRRPEKQKNQKGRNNEYCRNF